jgi:hypothetical protein
MREYDDNTQSYAPMLRRIVILVAVVIAVPVMLWAITGFMRSYIAQPTIPDPKPLASAPSTATPPGTAADTASINNAGPAAPPSAPPAVTTPDARAADNGANASAPDKVATATVGQPAPAASPWPSAPTPAPAAAPAPSVFPDPPAITAQTPPAPTVSDTADDALPPPDPITGPVPMPRQRPSILALADGPVPLPRARPAGAPEPEKPAVDTPAVFDPGIGGGVSGAH